MQRHGPGPARRSIYSRVPSTEEPTMNQVITEALQGRKTLYSPEFEHDACGVGFIASVQGKRSNQVLRYGIDSLCHLVHRGALDADTKTGDGAGVMTQIPYKVLVPEVKRLG